MFRKWGDIEGLELPTSIESAQILIGIGNDLGNLFVKMAKDTQKIDELTALLDAQKIALIPIDGWAGSNESQRNAARDKRYLEDKEVQASLSALRILLDEQIVDRAFLQSLEARRRAIEWTVRIMALPYREAQINLTYATPFKENATDANHDPLPF